MVLKLFGLGIKVYVSDGFNVFDAIIVIISLVELFAASEASGLSVLRAFRLLRIFKIIKSWVSLRQLLATVLKSLSAITNLGFLTSLFLFIGALLAKQFYSKPLIDGDGEISRYGFTSTPFSLVTIFIVLTGENWNQIMVETMGTYKTVAGPAIFFMSMIIIGNYMLLNLFLAILLKFIGEKDEDDDVGDEKAGGDSTKLKKVDDKLQPPSEESEDSLGLNSSNSNLEEEFE